MPYIGKSPVGGGFHKLDNLTASATATYALTLSGAAYYPETANQLLVSLNGVIQAPQDSFTVSGSNLIFDTALTASDSIDFVVALGDVLGVGSVTDGAITTAKIGNGAVTDAKIAAMAASKLTGSVPSAAMPAGSVLQVQSVNKIDTQAIAGTTFTDVMSVSITPISTSSKILVQCNLNITAAVTDQSTNGHRYSGVKLYRDSTQIAVNSEISGIMGSVWFSANQVDLTNTGFTMNQSSGSFIDSPTTTSAITYKIQAGNTASSTVYTYINRISYGPNDNQSYNHKGVSNMTLMEIAG